ncbi:hypothetical protein IFO69_19540 [Echinicola sp. CAU 1574]|uniref:Uncharacterized protein n=1 Tax=Echinicola arenosa TaxID=2774144 RepID=A0ABR9ARF9_9BACT|nr:hypothetical protein [Echinicola arenosa]MBD8490956.1 hypothetical protein [Echinicola arenosa]
MKKISWILLCLIICNFGINGALAKTSNMADSVVYVWDFAVSDAEMEDIGVLFTEDFETELISYGIYTVLERRNYNRVIAHRDMEKRISAMNTVSEASRDSLRAVSADAVAFGEVFDDVQSGEYEVTVTFQDLDGVILRKGSILIKRGIINDNRSRKEAMRNLVTMLHEKENLEIKRGQYEFISSWLSSYLVKVKDVNSHFKQVSQYAFTNSDYLSEINKIVGDYNEVFTELNEKGPSYILDFKETWGEDLGGELQGIHDMIMNDIHKQEILGLNEVLLEIIDYSGLSKKEKKSKKEEILKDSEKITDELDRKIGVLEVKESVFLSQLKKQI